jgi:DNA-binding LytR/AlgR family response regulator
LHVESDDEGRLLLSLKNHPRKLPVSRLYAHRFKAL